jgi:hypothetical protein
MLVSIAVAWSGMSTNGTWDALPLVCASLLILAARLAGIRLRWWGMLLGVAGGMLCATLVAHFGPWAALIVCAMVFAASAPIARARRGG